MYADVCNNYSYPVENNYILDYKPFSRYPRNDLLINNYCSLFNSPINCPIRILV